MHIEDSYRHKGLRKRLVAAVASKGIREPTVLSALAAVPRHVFFDKAFVEHAYEDKPFPIGEGQTISQPYTVAFQTQLLGLKREERVLEIGTGSGYQACILCAMGARVFSIERHHRLHMRAKQLLFAMGYQALLVQGDGSKGLPTYAPYDAILVTAAAPFVPQVLMQQLKPLGRLVIPIGSQRSQQMIRLTLDTTGTWQKETFDHFRFVPLIGAHAWKK